MGVLFAVHAGEELHIGLVLRVHSALPFVRESRCLVVAERDVVLREVLGVEGVIRTTSVRLVSINHVCFLALMVR